MKRITALLAALALSACSLAPTAPSRAVYDLGPAPAATSTGGTLAWRVADVTAPPWLAGDGIAYRLAFQQAQRQEQYRDSLWAAPPATKLTFPEDAMAIFGAAVTVRPAEMIVGDPLAPQALGVMLTLPA